MKTTSRYARCGLMSARTGATMVELAIALSLLVTLMLGAVDLGFGVFQQHILTQASRHVARMAIVRGALAQRLEPWGPEAVEVQANASDPIATAIAPALVGLDLNEVELRVEWPDQTNDPRENARVRVRLTAPYRSLLTPFLGNPTIPLTAESTMYIAH